MTDPTTAAIIGELAKTTLQAIFAALKQAGKTDEEISKMIEESRQEFYGNDPVTLPDPPEDDSGD